MKGAQHFCSICLQEFTRKYNGERHNENLHGFQARIIPLRKFKHGTGTDSLRNKKFGFQSSIGPESKYQMLSTILERIGKEFESCEHELESLSQEERAVCLAQIVVQSLNYEDPKQPMVRYLKGIRNHRLNEKIIGYVAAGYKITPDAARQLLMSILK